MQLAEQFKSKLEEYLQTVREVSHTMKQEAWRRLMATSARAALSHGGDSDGGSPAWSMTSEPISTDEASTD